MTPVQWVLKKVAKTRGTRFRVWLLTIPLQPLPGGGPVEVRWHLKQWDQNAKEPLSWCLQVTKYASKAPGGAMDPYKPFQLLQVSERDWPAYLSTLAPEIRFALEAWLPAFKEMAPPVQVAPDDTKEVA